MIPQSIRWRLPLTYAGIAFIAAVILGVALLATLRGYYAERERTHLEDNARAISNTLRLSPVSYVGNEEFALQLNSLAFIMQARVRVFDADDQLITDTGSPLNLLSIGSGEGIFTIQLPFDQQLRDTTTTLDAGQSYGVASGARVSMLTTADVQVNQFVAARGGAQLTVGMEGSKLQPNEDTMMFAVSSTPYGFDLAGEVTPGVVSDQRVRLPLYDVAGTLSGYVELSEGASFGSHIVESVGAALLFAGVIAVMIAAIIGWFVSRQITTPVLVLTNGAESMARGELHTRVLLRKDDEFGALANTFNEMAAQVEATISALRRFVADAAHELHTPLTALHADLELAATESDPDQQMRYVRRAYAQVRRLELLTDNLLDLSRIESKTRCAPFRPVDVTHLVRDLSETYASRAEQVGVNFTLNVPDQPLIVCGDEVQLRRAVGNLLDNAIKFTPEGGTVALRLTRAEHRVAIVVNDTGIGIPTDDIRGLFNRFHRGRNANTYPGSGLGLAIIRAIADVHHGDISVQSVPGDTRFTLQLPAA